MRRLPILLMLVVLPAVFVACTESGSLPTGPPDSEPDSPWRVIYPLLTSEYLASTWGLDADDMWAVGSDGVILHFDGRRCTRVESPTDENLDHIHGRARDDVWAIGSSEVLHWDGRRWSVVSSDQNEIRYSTVWCTAGGDVFVGGRARDGDDWLTAVRRFDGSRWWNTHVPFPGENDVGHIWQPEPDGPVLMSTSGRLFRFDNSRWTPMTNQISIWDVDGPLAIGRHPDHDYNLLYRFDGDGEPYAPCPEETLRLDGYNATHVADARFPVVESYGAAGVAHECRLTVLAEPIGGGLGDLTVPELLRPGGSVIFGAGYQGLFVRGALSDDRTVSWQSLVPEPREHLHEGLTGTADVLFGATWNDRLLVRQNGIWRLETHEGIPFYPELDLLPDGRLVAWGNSGAGSIVVRRPDATWYSMPGPPDYARHLWTDGDDDGLIYTSWNVEWTLAGGQWACTDSVAEGVRYMDGRSADEIYRLTETRILQQRIDGRWEPILGDEHDRVWSCYLSPWTDDIYVFIDGIHYHRCTAVLRHGLLTVLTERDEERWESEKVCEARPGEFYSLEFDEIFRLRTTAWQPTPSWQPIALDDGSGRPRSVWGHPNQGLFVLDNHGNLHHRPFPETPD